MKVFVSGSFDLLHSGHVAFLEETSGYGDLYVGIGSDKSIEYLKSRKTIYSQEERLLMVKAIKYVKDVNINSGMGLEDFEHNPFFISCDMLIVNEDQASDRKRELCEKFGKQYIILKRIPHKGLPSRSTTEMRKYYDITSKKC